MSVSETIQATGRTGRDVKTILALVGMAAFFGTNLVIARDAIDSTGPWTLAFCRWSGAALMLLPFAWRSMAAAWPMLRAEAPRLFTLGFLGMIICGGGVYVALDRTTATNGILIYTASPAFAVLIDALVARRRPAAAEMAGLAFATLGIAAIVFRGDPALAAQLSFGLGDLGIAAAALSWAIYGAVLKGGTFGRIPTLASFTAIATAGALLLAPLSLVELAFGASLPATPEAFASILALALFPSVLAFSLFQYGVKRVGPAVAAMFLYLMPVFGVLMASVMLNEVFRPYHAAGFALVLGGVVLATTHRRMRR